MNRWSKDQRNNNVSERNLGVTRILAWLSLFWEKLWPLILPFCCVLALFLTVSFLGLWSAVPEYARIGLLGLFAAVALLSLYPLRGLQSPAAASVDGRIEQKSGLVHRPVTAQKDRRADLSGGEDAFSKALWSEHQKRMANSLSGLKSGLPVPCVASHDPYALRAFAGLLLFIGIIVGWGNWSNRVGDAFRSHRVEQFTQTGRIDAWVTPPAYTNRPPIFLNREVTAVTVPEGSEFFARTLDWDNPSLAILSGGNKTTGARDSGQRTKANAKGRRYQCQP